jgi:hypothetical protein
LYSRVDDRYERKAGYALPDGKTIVIAKRALHEMGEVIAHELGHIEHLTIHPLSADWTDQACENYACTLEWYFDEDSFQHGCTISQYISFNEKRKIVRESVSRSNLCLFRL